MREIKDIEDMLVSLKKATILVSPSDKLTDARIDAGIRTIEWVLMIK